jgi:L-2-hydroxyglutarate oxidase LhgO
LESTSYQGILSFFSFSYFFSSNFIVQFGPHYVCREFEYHCSSAIIATVAVKDLPPGEVAVLASNDGGKHFGPSGVFRFYDNQAHLATPHTENIALLQGIHIYGDWRNAQGN